MGVVSLSEDIMAKQVYVKNRLEEEKIIQLSREEAVMIIKNLIDLLAGVGGGGIVNTTIYCEDPKEVPYRLYLTTRR